MYERDYNQPSFSKDVEYTECEYCCGDGFIHSGTLDDDGYFEEVNCPTCNGHGQLPIE